jgi:hypothetical protein
MAECLRSTCARVSTDSFTILRSRSGTRSRIRISVSSFRTSAYLRAKSERKNGGSGRERGERRRGMSGEADLVAKMVGRETRKSRKAGEAAW